MALSTLHVYNGTVTAGGTDGAEVAELTSGSNRIVLSAYRTETAEGIFAVRATAGSCYAVTIEAVSGEKAALLISTDGGTWKDKIHIPIVSSVNYLFYLYTLFDKSEAYGDHTNNYLAVTYLAPV